LNIIFGTREAQQLSDKYIVLELDTVTIRDSAPVPVYCLIENMPLDELSNAEKFKKLHAELMENYRKRNWDFCLQAINHLIGFWGNQVDSFYEVLSTRITGYKETEPDESWTGIIPKGNIFNKK
jgi:hypothetical protein